MVLSKVQTMAIKTIEDMNRDFGELRWFTVSELPGITYKTLYALCKNHHRLEMMKRHVNNVCLEYFRLVKLDDENHGDD